MAVMIDEKVDWGGPSVCRGLNWRQFYHARQHAPFPTVNSSSTLWPRRSPDTIDLINNDHDDDNDDDKTTTTTSLPAALFDFLVTAMSVSGFSVFTEISQQLLFLERLYIGW